MAEQGTGYDSRLQIRQGMLDKGLVPYPQDGHRTHTTQEALGQELGERVTIAGRIKSMRGHGKIIFIDVEDEAGHIQTVVKSDHTENFSDLKNIGLDDFFRVDGVRFVTQRGEQSVLADKIDLLSKTLRVLPDGHKSTMTDEEELLRNRSVDMAIHPELRGVLQKRSHIIQSVRQTLDDRGFIELETPTLQSLYGGANARPFTTHINAWDMDMYLRISPELYLKYLIMGGFERVYEITKNFRNEGVDKTHNPEFTMMECYAAYWDYHDMMNLTEEIYEQAAFAANGSPIVTYQGTELDFSQPWRRLTMHDGIQEYLGIDVNQLSDEQLQNALQAHNINYEGQWVRGLGIAKLFEPVEEHLIQPSFVTDFPRETTTLCKPHRDKPELIERFEPYIWGMEVGNAYTELNDPVLQRKFWEEEREGDPEAHPLDEGFIRAMEYGMPPTGGLGLGIDRMTMLLTDQTKIRGVIPFPTIKSTR